MQSSIRLSGEKNNVYNWNTIKSGKSCEKTEEEIQSYENAKRKNMFACIFPLPLERLALF